MSAKISDTIVAKIEAMIAADATRAEIGATLGISRNTILRLLQAGKLSREPRRASNARRAKRLACAGSVPMWVQGDLRGEYRENMNLYGEDHAARLARRAQAEAARPGI